MSTQYPLTPGALTSDCYPADPQTFYNEMFAKGYVTLNIEGVIVQNATPAATDRDKLWVKIDGSGNYLRSYTWSTTYGVWVNPHPVPNDDKRRYIFTGTLAQITTLDGGTADAVTATTGAFWERDSNFDAVFPVGVGTFSGGTVVGELGTGGADEVTLTAGELPTGATVEVSPATRSFATHDTAVQEAGGDSNPSYSFFGSTPTFYPTASGTIDNANDEAHNNLPPYYGVYFIGRTSRVYYTG